MSPIDNWDSYGPVFTNGPGSFLTTLFVVLAVAATVAFLVRIALHEKHAYAELASGEPVEPGPAIESEPPVS